MSGAGAIRVAQVARPAAGGIRRHISLLVAGLDKDQFLPSVYAPADFTLEGECVDVTRHVIAIGAKTNPAADLRLIIALARQLRGQTDLVHAHGLRAALIGVLAAKRAGIPALFTAHNLVPPLNHLQRSLLRTVGNSAAAILAVSEAVAASLQAVGLPKSKIRVISNGIPLAPFDSIAEQAEFNANASIISPLATTQERPEGAASTGRPLVDTAPLLPKNARPGEAKSTVSSLLARNERLGEAKSNVSPLLAKNERPGEGPGVRSLAAIGRLEREKGFDLLISAFDLVLERRTDVHLTIAGAGAEAATLQAQARAMKLPVQIYFPGQLDNIVPLLEAASLVVVPSRQEGQGIVALEAMAARRAVIATHVGGLAETIVPDVTGLLVPPENAPALARAILSLLDDDTRRQAMGAAGRRRVEQLYTVERMITNIQAVYQSLPPLR